VCVIVVRSAGRFRLSGGRRAHIGPVGAAAYGVLTWVFQSGHLGSVLGFVGYGGVVGWLPLFMFVLLFGLSMDCHIFILSRVREGWAAGVTPDKAISAGIAASAGVVRSAAVIMIAVFSIYITLSAIEFKVLGLGMAVAILIAATLVRGVLLPAAMSLLGRRAWAAPGWLERLGRLADDLPEAWLRSGSRVPAALVGAERAEGLDFSVHLTWPGEVGEVCDPEAEPLRGTRSRPQPSHRPRRRAGRSRALLQVGM